MRNIKLAIFNEDYWSKGLIYSQNIKPLIYLAKRKGYSFSIISFTSIFMLIRNWKKIAALKHELKNEHDVNISNYPMLFYPTRYMILKKWLIPFFNVNISGYIKKLRKQCKSDDIIFLRSYPISYAFNKYYGHKSYLIFDPRTDWINENISIGLFKQESHTVSFWLNEEKKIVSEFDRTIFISNAFRDDILARHNIKYNPQRHIIQYNTIDIQPNYNNFQHTNNRKDFVYSGSLGHWNNLETYLDFFKSIHSYFPDSNFIICTSSAKSKINSVLSHPEYADIRSKIFVYYNLTFNNVIEIYKSCKYGLQIMDQYDSRVGVKIIEYIVTSLIPITNDNVHGAVEILEQYNIGAIIHNNDSINNIVNKIKAANIINYNNSKHIELLNKFDSQKAYTNLNL